jgi:hypothetical protein
VSVDSYRQLRQAAHAYADAGWHVFPLRHLTKRPAVPDHPAHRCNLTAPACAAAGTHVGWEAAATTDHDQIDTWWSHWCYGIGIATGPSGLVVIDLDTPNHPDGPHGADVLDALAADAGQPVPATHTVTTPSGGRHLYYTAPARPEGAAPGPALGNTAGRLGPRIDTRAAGGYVVAPPTTLPGGPYTVARSASPVELPHWLNRRLTPPRPRPAPGPPADRPSCAPGPSCEDEEKPSFRANRPAWKSRTPPSRVPATQPWGPRQRWVDMADSECPDQPNNEPHGGEAHHQPSQPLRGLPTGRAWECRKDCVRG